MNDKNIMKRNFPSVLDLISCLVELCLHFYKHKYPIKTLFHTLLFNFTHTQKC